MIINNIMFIDQSEQFKLLKRFPKFELSYEAQIHKKVYTNDDIFIAIPYGKKYFAWFTYYHNNNVCFLCELHPNKKIKNMKQITCCYHSNLSYGTVLYGSLVENRFFVAENIYYLEGNKILYKTNIDRLKKLEYLFMNTIKQKSVIKHDIIFTTPPINTVYNDLLIQLETLPYSIYGIKFIDKYNTHKQERIFVYKQERKQHYGIFRVMSTVKNDIYELYYFGKENKIVKHNIAYIPSYTSSVMMNNKFRQIKENARLDSLEESDSEDEFENMDENKYVDTNKKITMRCRFNTKFKKWEPIEMVEYKERLINYDDLWTVENKFIKTNRRVEFPKYRRF